MKRHKSKIFSTILLTIFFVGGCFAPSISPYFTPEEKERYDDFFKKFLFLEQAVFTLYGTKPITEIILFPETPEEKLAAQEKAVSRLSKEELSMLKDTWLEYEEKFWFEETWGMWEEKLKTLPIKRYLFVERKIGIPEYLKKNRYIYFINITETAKVLKKHYSLFREYVGFDFDPLSVVFDAQNETSPFWNAIWGRVTDKSVCLMGILFGYGFENSYPFSWHFIEGRTSEEDERISAVLKSGMPTAPLEVLRQFNPPKSFLLPAYASFSEYDPHKEKYMHEYSMIQKIYMHSDITNCTMKQLLN